MTENNTHSQMFCDHCGQPKNLEISLGFENVTIKQKKNICNSRLDVNISSEIIKGVKRPIPLIAANMSTVINSKFYIKLFKLGAFAVLHRADTKKNIIQSIKEASKECEWVAGSVGVGEDQYELCKEMVKAGCNIVVIDIAHGYSDAVINLGERIKSNYPRVKVVLGNTVNIGLLEETKHFADAIKVGIAQGFACETKNTAGCTEKQFSAVLKFKTLAKKYGIPVISDGGIRLPADFVKAIGAGANSVMAGKIFAACPESAAELIQFDDKPKKIYAGMACYSQDTEILTKSGWKIFEELSSKDEIATLNPITNELEYQLSTKIYSYEYNGDMINVVSRPIDLLVTPNHRMYTAKRNRCKKAEFGFVEAQDACKEPFLYKKDCIWNGDRTATFVIPDIKVETGKHKTTYYGFKIPMNEWLDFFGFWLAKGSCHKRKIDSLKEHYCYEIDLSNNDKTLIEHYKNLLASWNIKSRIRKRNKNYELTIINYPLFNYLSCFGKANNKFIPEELRNLSSDLLEILLKSISLGDGCKKRNCIYTNSPKLRDHLYEIAIKTGRTPSIHINHPIGSIGVINGKSFKRNYTVWSVSLNDNFKTPHIHVSHYKKQKYDGKVYCVTVPNGIVCVRRNNKYVWSGNSEYVQMGWKNEVKIGTVAEGRICYLDPGEPAEVVLNNFAGSLRSGITYAGCKDVDSFQEKVEFIRLA
jgi:IMP dehydrogenase/GMP reductase